MPGKIIILCPFYNDSASLTLLLKEFDERLGSSKNNHFSFLIINDGSSETLQAKTGNNYDINILHLQRNLGHQKAICIGLAYIKDNLKCDKVLIMDCDGEDRPEDAIKLIDASASQPDKIIFGKRQSRTENSHFIFFYFLYKFLFKLLIGRTISFGHFLIMPYSILEKIVYYSEIWNHVVGGIIKSGLPYTTIETHRGKRYAGTSKMNFTALFLHGFGAIAVFIDRITVRLLFFSIITITFSLLSILAIFAIRTFTDLAIPGWASTLASLLLIVLLQGFLLSLFTMFLYLSSQSQRKFIPAYHYKDYTGNFETIK
ncbi:MAG: glycosyltransferase family 2 protein [Chitinophagaceae bacterium]